MRVYHGSPARFKQFDYTKIRTNGSTEGVGFYFTDARRIAEGYAGDDGFVLEATFHGGRALDPKRVTIDRDDFKRFLDALDARCDYLANWGDVTYTGRASVLEDATQGEYDDATDDVSLIGSIVNAAGDIEATLRTCADVLGFDHIVTTAEWGGDQTIYIALTPDAYTIDRIVPRRDQPEGGTDHA